MLFNSTKNRQSEVRSTTFTEIFLIFLVILFLFVIEGQLEIADLENNEIINLKNKIDHRRHQEHTIHHSGSQNPRSIQL